MTTRISRDELARRIAADIPEGAVVTVTVSEVELLRARMRLALVRNAPRRTRARVLFPEALLPEARTV